MSLPPPGWYPDPANPQRERIWNGHEWGNETRNTPPEGIFSARRRHTSPGRQTALLLGLALIAGGVLWFMQGPPSNRIPNPEPADATIVFVEKQTTYKDNRPRTICTLRIHYTIENQRWDKDDATPIYVADTPISSSTLCKYKVGQSITIYYDPENPTHIETSGLDTQTELLANYGYLLLLGLGALLTTPGIIRETSRVSKHIRNKLHAWTRRR